MGKLGVLITWRAVTETEPTLEMIDARLSPFRLDSVLLGVARLAGRLKTWQNATDMSAEREFAARFLPTYWARLKPFYDRSPAHVLFARITLIFLAKQACRFCALDGRNINNDSDVEQVLSCCLLANDLLLERNPTLTDTVFDQVAGLLPFANYVPRDNYSFELARGLLLIEDIAPLLASRKDYIDIGSAFMNSIGLSPRRFSQLAFGAATRFINNVDTQLSDPTTAFILTPEYFQHTAIMRSDIDIFLRQLSISPDRLRAESRKRTHGADFVAFQRHPLIEYADDKYICLDPGFLIDKAGPSLFWTLHEATNRRNELLSFWPRVIERYVEWLFENGYKGTGYWKAGPIFPNGDEACDLILVEGEVAVFMEVKASILTTEAKYGFSSRVLTAELEKKAITGDDSERKGVAQLANGLTRFLKGDEIDGIDRMPIRTIYPILAFLDHGFTAPGLSGIYNHAFQTRITDARTSMEIAPLFSLNIDDLENMLPHLAEVRFADILRSYLDANPAMFGEISRASVPILRGRTPGEDRVKQRFREFGGECQRVLFPNEPS